LAVIAPKCYPDPLLSVSHCTHTLHCYYSGDFALWYVDDAFDWQLGREVLDEAAKAVAVGVTTDEIDRLVHEVRHLKIDETVSCK